MTPRGRDEIPGEPAGAAISLRGIAKRFGAFEAVQPLDLDVPAGSFVALLGPSGCGKTTTLRILAGLETPTEGRVEIGGRDVTKLPPKDRDVAMVFQNYALYPHLTVADNIAYPLKARKVKRAERDEVVRRAAGALGLAEVLDRRPKQLSGGQRQRVALARAIVRQPAAFLMDEPLSNLDAKLRVQMRAELKHLQRELGVTTIYVTHDQVEATTMADSVVVMNGGRLEQHATPRDLYDRPANATVASFIGSPPMNLLSVTMSSQGLRLTEDGTRLPVGERTLIRLGAPAEGRELLFGFRPEAVRAGIAADQGMPASVFAVQPLDHELLVTFAFAATTQAIGRFRISDRFQMGDTVTIGFEEDELYLFDRATGDALPRRPDVATTAEPDPATFAAGRSR